MNKESWTSFIVGLAATFVSVGIAYGVCASKISQLEQQAIQMKLDHDQVVALIVKFDMVIDDLKEIKFEIKELKGMLKDK